VEPSLFDELVQSLKEAIAISKGRASNNDAAPPKEL
jgi:hypothetical protein